MLIQLGERGIPSAFFQCLNDLFHTVSWEHYTIIR